MTTRLYVASSRFAVAHLLAGCCLLFVGCEGWGGGKAGLPEVKNPFAKKATPEQQQQTQQPAKVGPEFYSGLTTGRKFEKTGRMDEARRVYEGLIVKNPGRYEPYHRLGVVADRQKRYREAQALYAQAISIHPDPQIFNDLGYCLYLQGKLEKAESALLKAVSMQPANSRFRNNLAMVYGHQGRDEEAMEEFRRGGSEADAFYNMAFILASRDDVDGAKNCFRLALAADPSHDKATEALRSFDQSPHSSGGDEHPIADSGRRMVPYVEGGKVESGEAQPASYDAPASLGKTAATSPTRTKTSGRVVPSTRPDTQAILRRARSMMSQRMGDETVTQ